MIASQQLTRRISQFAVIPLFVFCIFTSISQSAIVETEGSNSALAAEMAKQLVCYPLELLNLNKHRPTLATRELCLATIYHEQGAHPLWVTAEGPGEKAYIILDHLKKSQEHGLDTTSYQLGRITELWQSTLVEDLAELDALLTYSLVKYFHDLSYGQLKPHEANPELFAEAGDANFDPVKTVELSLASTDLDSLLKSLPPQHQHYLNLKSALKKYRQLAEAGGWPSIPQGKTLHPGDTHPRVSFLRKRLEMSRDFPLPLVVEDTDNYDNELEKAVLRFQNRHGLEADGLIGKQTLAALNFSVEERINTIRLNMARWRWQAHDLGEKYVLVNIASFNLKAYKQKGENLILDIPVIVGKLQHQTPVFSDSIKYVDVNPFWNITPSIARNEELPELRKNPYHLAERNVRLFSSWQHNATELDSTTIDWHSVTRSQMSSYKLRQDPGPWNALGKIKFVFPNRYSVYMHDTPAPTLFNHTKRDFSHGCIRVSDPLALALFVLDDHKNTWGEEKVRELYDQTSRKVIRLSTPLPVHITYQTTWVDKDGTIHFNSDIYARDEELHKSLLK